MYAERLVELSTSLGFDGWLVNSLFVPHCSATVVCDASVQWFYSYTMVPVHFEKLIGIELLNL